MNHADAGRATTMTRRSVLTTVGSVGLAIGVAAGQDSSTETTAGNGTDTGVDTETSGGEEGFVLVQGEQCVPLQPLSGNQSVTDFYDYGLDRYSSRGTADLQRDDTSILFLYDGPEGTSLVLVHGRLDGSDDGGSVSFAIEGLPADGQWVIRDDSYDRPTRYDRWNTTETTAEVDWTWRQNRADGGVYRGLNAETVIEIDPAFNEAAALYGEHYDGTLRRWQAVSGDRDDPDYTSLAMDQPIRIRSGSCSEAGAANATGNESSNASTNGRAISTNATANATNATTSTTTATPNTTTANTTTAAPTTAETTTAETTTETATSTATTSEPTTDATTVATSDTTTATAEATTTTAETTATDGPGFGGAAAIAALASAAAFLRSRVGEN